jgi:hypothetical protein
MSSKKGLVATVYPRYFNTTAFGALTNCFTFLTGFDESFMDFYGVKELRPEDLGWTRLSTQQEWISAVNAYFNASRYGESSKCARLETHGGDPLPDTPYVSSTFLCDSTGLHWTPPSVPAVCFPMVKGARDCHWCAFNGTYWLEQAGHAGPMNVWASQDDMIADVYTRGDSRGNLYVPGSHFFFSRQLA